MSAAIPDPHVATSGASDRGSGAFGAGAAEDGQCISPLAFSTSTSMAPFQDPDVVYIPLPQYDAAADAYVLPSYTTSPDGDGPEPPDGNGDGDTHASPALHHANLKRQYASVPAGMVGIPGCVTRCMVSANAGFCASNQDYLCLCSNHAYQGAVTQCWAMRCNATSFDLALSYASAACTAIGAKIDPGSNGASTNLTMRPVVFSRAAFNIQAVMSSLCSFVLLCAIGLGILSCRSQARRQAMMSSTAWSHATNPPTAKSRVSRVPRSYFPGREHGQVSTIDIGSSVDFEEMFGQPMQPRRQPRFTNRLPHERPFTNRLPPEEWEMEASGRGSGTQDEKRSEHSTSSKVTELTGGGQGSSVVHLNPATPSTVYMVTSNSSASLQRDATLDTPPPIQRPQSAPPSPRSPHTYSPQAAHAQ
ncbi:hypothetical protein CC85DRAFT_300695 [Cutaneotrichosporon oleaginosum]|uniref:CFEM domain-containing protein n=1 Tax=Cutaneotrichosporon oleaginosum TaxID=879819 RepID=A0A0J0XT57_9TREE|nr:uncharacterized protein CC85DRAFT_300695 [Cutaneotrichosporon oleaginosum]KLT44271.1 hypothetical protein CC85DRAFT_300695 [Cutaneotrichosporon oleaginosum]TXT11561.1 hypothetical protein COLE_01971 [Cutaneotrichosporon oleaginosum]